MRGGTREGSRAVTPCARRPQAGDLPFVLSVASARPVRIEPVPPAALVEPRGGIGGGGDDDAWGGGAGTDSEEEEEEGAGAGAGVGGDVRFPEHMFGAARAKRGRAVPVPPDRRTPEQIAAECARLRRRFEDPAFPPGPAMLFRDPAGGPAVSAMPEVAARAAGRGVRARARACGRTARPLAGLGAAPRMPQQPRSPSAPQQPEPQQLLHAAVTHCSSAPQ